MTEAQWLACNNLHPMLQFLGNRITERKYRLFGAACCRHIWNLLHNDNTRHVVEVAEQVADGQATLDILGTVWQRAYAELITDEDADAAYNLGWGGLISGSMIFGQSMDHPHFGTWFYTYRMASDATDAVARSKGGISCLEELPIERRGDEESRMMVALYEEACRMEDDYQVAMLHCVFGNPFNHRIFSPTHRTSNALSVARAIYDEKAFDRLPILADALEDAGCTDPEILNHCRQPGEHVRGCWVVDLVLAKE